MRFEWLAGVWQAYISPRRSVLYVRILRNRIATNDNLKNCGMIFRSYCCMRMRSDETVNHLFLHCSFARVVWRLLFDKCNISLTTDGDY